MKAAVIETFGRAPTVTDFRDPEAGEGESVVTVHAAALSPIVKALAAGKHYTSRATAEFVPGVDGVGLDGAGRRVYFLFPKAPFGSMAEKSLVASDMMAPVPEDLSDLRAAAIATAGLASWVALSRRARLAAGETVLVIGATGSAGGMALQTARYLGASRVIAVGRNEERLAALDADVKIALNENADEALSAEFGRGVDVVLDFVWGEPATRVLSAATRRRGSPAGERRLRYVQLGTLAGDEIPLRGDMLRSTGVELLGSGIGSVAVKDLVAAAGELLAAAPRAGFNAPFTSVPLQSIANAWNGDPNVRYILTPSDSSAQLTG